ncbi:MAG: fluoride efflux transporter FluC [Bacillota bacterium]
MKRKMFNSYYVAAGGAVGSLLRYIVSFVHSYEPYSTLFVNLLGSFLLGFITAFFLQRKEQEWLKLILGTGFCGGFTTMSTFSFELTLLPLEQAILYMSCSVVFSFILVMLGIKLAGMLARKETEKW